MKIEIGESLCYSYLRHVKQCWLVQTNWKASEHWKFRISQEEIESKFQDMKHRFHAVGDVFRRTTDAAQFLRQGEIDVVGIDQAGCVHAIDVAFHEHGLNYTNGVENNVFKKMLRSYLTLRAILGQASKLHIYFVSAKVQPKDRKTLNYIFEMLQEAYPDAEWSLIINDDFDCLVEETVQKASTVADTSELFIRASKLISMSVSGAKNRRESASTPATAKHTSKPVGKIQPIVQSLMTVLLEDHPSLLNDSDIRRLMDSDYCKRELRLEISNHALLREVEQGRVISDHSRYYAKRYADKFYVCSQWWKEHHISNANSLYEFTQSIIEKNSSHPGVTALSKLKKEFLDYAQQT